MASLTPGPWAELQCLVLKKGVGLGGLGEVSRARALALVWAGLPADALTERQVNEAIKAQLGGAAAFLDTDHVELRRWLVDGGWLARDGFGREYRRVAAAALPARWQALAEALSSTDIAAWVAQLQRQKADRRETRRQAWTASRTGASA